MRVANASRRLKLELAAVVFSVPIAALLLGYTTLAFVAAGGFAVLISVRLCASLVHRVNNERDLTRMLLWDLLLVLILALGLTGVGLMAAPWT